jgi:hypothetical protein
MLAIPMVLPIAIEIAMLKIDTIINEKIPIPINIQPSARMPAPTIEGETWKGQHHRMSCFAVAALELIAAQTELWFLQRQEEVRL